MVTMVKRKKKKLLEREKKVKETRDRRMPLLGNKTNNTKLWRSYSRQSSFSIHLGTLRVQKFFNIDMKCK